MTALVYDAGALIAAERDDRRLWEIHRRALRRGVRPIVPTTVLAQVRRGDSADRGLAKLLDGCRIAALDRAAAELVGDLLGAAGRSDIVDAHVVICCLVLGGGCVTSDRADIAHLAEVARTDRRRRFGRSNCVHRRCLSGGNSVGVGNVHIYRELRDRVRHCRGPDGIRPDGR